MIRSEHSARLAWSALFAVAMAYLEAAVVVYLRELYYPEGFRFPLKMIPEPMILVELGREAATLVMLAAVAVLCGRSLWERFAWFLWVFGVWDIWYYIWLKVTIDWPATLLDWDILFLIPLPWIGPVLAPLAVAVSMTAIGWLIIRRAGRGMSFRVTKGGWLGGIAGTALILYSFMYDLKATLYQQMPQPYPWWLLVLGLAAYWAGFLHAWRRNAPSPHQS